MTATTETTATAAAATVPGDLLARRYGVDDATASRESSPTIDLQLAHRSVRRFLPDDVPGDQVELIVAAAQSASQSSNLQVWSVIEVRDADRRRRISHAIGGRPYVESAPVLLAWVADFRRAARIVESAGSRIETLGYLENTLVPFVDAGIAAQNALLAAESLGLGGVFVGSLRNAPEAVVTELGLPEHTFPVFGLTIGHPDPSERAGVKPRLPRPAVLHREQYDPDAWREAADAYEPRVREYFAEHGRDDYSWRDILTRRVSTIEGLHGRHTIRGSLAAQGFLSD